MSEWNGSKPWDSRTKKKKEERREEKCTEMTATCALLCADYLQLLGNVYKVVGIGLWLDLALVGFLDKVFVTLLVGKVDGVIL
jgi:hypothetical protein